MIQSTQLSNLQTSDALASSVRALEQSFEGILKQVREGMQEVTRHFLDS